MNDNDNTVLAHNLRRLHDLRDALNNGKIVKATESKPVNDNGYPAWGDAPRHESPDPRPVVSYDELQVMVLEDRPLPDGTTRPVFRTIDRAVFFPPASSIIGSTLAAALQAFAHGGAQDAYEALRLARIEALAQDGVKASTEPGAVLHHAYHALARAVRPDTDGIGVSLSTWSRKTDRDVVLETFETAIEACAA